MPQPPEQTQTNVNTPLIIDANELLKKLLLQELPLQQHGIDISFEQPTREWSGQINQPTLNLFLYELRRNKLRQSQWEISQNQNGRKSQQRPALRFDLHYLVTAWVLDSDPDEEHYLLTAALMALSRHPRLPDIEPSATGYDPLPASSRIDKAFLPERLQHQPGPIPLRVADPDDMTNPADIWSALENALRPSIPCILTLAFDPFQHVDLALVKRRELRFKPIPDSSVKADQVVLDYWPDSKRRLYQLAGTIQNKEALPDVQLKLTGQVMHRQGLVVPLTANKAGTRYDFTIDQLAPGPYNLKISTKGRSVITFEILLSAELADSTLQEEGVKLHLKIAAQTYDNADH